MGGVADYSGALLLQLPIADRTLVRLSWREGSEIVLTSELPSREVLTTRHSLEEVRQLVAGSDADSNIPSWARYVLGACALAESTRLLHLRGMLIEVQSEIALGAGLSSSAALEVATLRVLAKAYSFRIPPLELARLAQRVENEVVGAPCGLMDQLAVHCGQVGQLLPIRCQPAWVGDPIRMPRNAVFERYSSGVGHSIADNPYGRARAATFMGRQILESKFGISSGGYLANIDANRFRSELELALPETMSGATFLERYGELNDQLSIVEVGTLYRVRACTAHPVYEEQRVQRFEHILRDASLHERRLSEEELVALGTAMLESHHSYSSIGLGHEATDALVDKLLSRSEVYGARVTGGGAGGTVVALVRA